MSHTHYERLWRRLLIKLGAEPDASASEAGRWPRTRQGFLWDLAPAAVAPGSDGVQQPEDRIEPWLGELDVDDLDDSALDRLIDAERRRHTEARDAATVAEAKASRLLTPTVGLLTGSVALTALQLRAAGRADTATGTTLLVIAALPGAIAVGYLFTCLVRALDADIRVGVYGVVGAAQQLSGDHLHVLRGEHIAANRAHWTARNKATQLMYARAAFSRAVVFLALSLLLAGTTTVLTPANPDDTTKPAPSPTSSPTNPGRVPPPTATSNPSASPPRSPAVHPSSSAPPSNPRPRRGP